MSKQIKSNQNSQLSLYKLTQNASEIISKAVDEDGFIEEDMISDLTASLDAIEEKAVSYCFSFDQIDSQLESMKNMSDQIKERSLALKNLKTRLQAVLLASLNQLDISKIESASHRITVGKKRATPNITDEALVEDRFKKFTVTLSFSGDCQDRILSELSDLSDVFEQNDVDMKISSSIDKKLLLDELKKGAQSLGAELIDDQKQLYIR